MAQVTIRRGLSVELDDIRSVIRAANEEFRDLAPAGFFRAYLASALDVWGRMEHGTVIVAESDGRLVGTVTFFPDANDEGTPTTFGPGTAGLRATAVHPEARGLGIGRRLVEACIERAVASGATSIALHTADFMRAAVQLYERTGFRRSPAHDFPAAEFFPSDPDVDLVAITYVRDLP